MIPIERYGYLEESYFKWCVAAMYSGSNQVTGFYILAFEITQQEIRSRRMRMLRYLGECLTAVRSVKQFWGRVLDGLEHEHYDVPFALLYSVADCDDTETISESSESGTISKTCLFEGSLGVPNAHVSSPPKLDLKRSQEGFVPAFRHAMQTREPTILQTSDGSLPRSLLDGIEWRGHGGSCEKTIRYMMDSPTTLAPANYLEVSGVLVLDT
jgi:hypothetical protein